MNTITEARPADPPTRWSGIICLSLLTFLLVGLEFMPVSLLTPIASDLNVSEGVAGQSITVSGLFAVITSLFGNVLLRGMDRRFAVLLYTAVLFASCLAVAIAPNFGIFLLGRALIGVAIGGFWSLSTAILARLSTQSDLPKAISMLQGGAALAVLLAAPSAAFLESLIGWRGTYFLTLPVGFAALIWQMAALPRLPPVRPVSAGDMLALLRNRRFALGMAATVLAFIGSNLISVYLRPFLEIVTGLDVPTLSLVLLALGTGGLVGIYLCGFAIRRNLRSVLVGLPIILAALAVLLIAFGSYAVPTAILMVMWGLFRSPISAAWNNWMARVIPDELEAGGGVQIALIQAAIASGALLGGLLFDNLGWWSAFVAATVFLVAAAYFAALAARL